MYGEIQEDKPAGHCQPQLLFATDETQLAALPSTYTAAWMAAV